MLLITLRVGTLLCSASTVVLFGLGDYLGAGFAAAATLSCAVMYAEALRRDDA
jgi:hypothetical protein